MSPERVPGDDVDQGVLELVSGAVARCILARADEGPRSAEELAEACDASLPTVYRRLNALEAHDLVHADTRIDPDGNHYETYETVVGQITVEVDGGDVAVDVRRRRDLVDRFEAFWGDLERGAGGDGGSDQ